MMDLSSFFSGDCLKILNYIHQNQEAQSFKDIQENLELEKVDDIFVCINFLRRFNYPINISYVDGEEAWLAFEQEPKEVQLSLSLFDWLSLQNELLGHSSGKLTQNFVESVSLNNKMLTLEGLSQQETARERESLEAQVHLEDLSRVFNRCIDKKMTCSISLRDGKFFDVYPHRVVFLEGTLTLIGEECSDRCLVHFSLHDILFCDAKKDFKYDTNFSTVEVEDFIYAVRSLNESEERLILKLSTPENVNLNPDFIFLGNPYVTTNMDGDFIWAASVEVSNELFEWLDSIDGLIDILDPQYIKDDFEQYRHNKKEKLRPIHKKAS